ncbi:MAG: glycosyltransferase [Lachnospiraceae bacterium]
MKRILILTEHLNIGGAEKALVRLLKSCDLKQYKVEVKAVFNEMHLKPEIPIEVNVSYIFRHRTIENMNMIQNNPKKVYNDFIEVGYDIEIAYIEGYPTAIIGASNNIKSYKVAWVHIDFRNTHHSKKAFLNDDDERRVYKKYHKILFCSDAALLGYKQYVNICEYNNQRLEVKYCMPIFEELDKLSNKYEVDEDIPFFCTLSRLVSEKGLERIIYATDILRKENYTFRCLIFGDGELQEELQSQIDELLLTDYVILKGAFINPYPYLKHSIAYVCSSIGESLCFAIFEALLLSVPVIACESSGTVETLKDAEVGLLVPNSKYGVLDGMRRILKNLN